MTHYMNHSLLGTRRVILSIITRNFFVIGNKQPMTIGTNRMCISRDDNCVNTMCFPRQRSRQLQENSLRRFAFVNFFDVIRVVLSVSYFLVSYFVMNFLRRIFSVCHSFWSMCQSGRMKGFKRCFKVEDQCNILRPLAKRIQINLYERHFEPFEERKIPPGNK